MQTHSCVAVIIAAPASGQGKTTLTAALASYYRQQDKRVRIFKIGPDFLDPMILERASDHAVYQLDLWMVGQSDSRKLLSQAAKEADIILIEGVMGLFDGDPSTADLAACFGIPVVAVIDASAMAQTFAALAYGLANFRDDIQLAGVIANRVGSERHQQMLVAALPEASPCIGWLSRQADEILPGRYLGLKQAAEIMDLDSRLETLAQQLNINPDCRLPQSQFSEEPAEETVASLAHVRIAVARDDAFSFIYQANLDLLREMGAELCFFSPLQDADLPEADSLYLPGGYPELYLQQLAGNKTMQQAIRTHYQDNKPIVAECGGMLFLCESLTDKSGQQASMTGILPAQATLQPRLTALALQEITLNGETVRGHSYHHSSLQTNLPAITNGRCPNGGKTAEKVFQQARLIASYIHFYFPSNPRLITDLFLP